MNIPIEKFAPTDSKGNVRMLGLFDDDGHYEEFINQGAKKYCYIKIKSNKKIDFEKENVIEKGEKESKVLEITVARCTKRRCKRTFKN